MKINSEKVAWKDAGKEIVVVDLETNSQYVFNETSRTIWLALDEGAETVDMIADNIREKFSDVPDEEALRRDVTGFLDSMMSTGLILAEETV